MSDRSFTIMDAIAAETAAAEASIVAERLRSLGAWFAYAAASELAKARRLQADQIKARLARHAIALAGQ